MPDSIDELLTDFEEQLESLSESDSLGSPLMNNSGIKGHLGKEGLGGDIRRGWSQSGEIRSQSGEIRSLEKVRGSMEDEKEGVSNERLPVKSMSSPLRPTLQKMHSFNAIQKIERKRIEVLVKQFKSCLREYISVTERTIREQTGGLEDVGTKMAREKKLEPMWLSLDVLCKKIELSEEKAKKQRSLIEKAVKRIQEQKIELKKKKEMESKVIPSSCQNNLFIQTPRRDSPLSPSSPSVEEVLKQYQDQATQKKQELQIVHKRLKLSELQSKTHDDLGKHFDSIDADQDGFIEVDFFKQYFGIQDLGKVNIPVVSDMISRDVFIGFFAGSTWKDNQGTVEPPTGRVTLVFTDITGSSALWARDSDTMLEAILIHNKVIRDCLNKFNGYEAKNDGDGFFIAFSNPNDAVSFALEAQVKLLEASWPESLLKIENTKVITHQSKKIFAGLSVRIGIHRGEAILHRSTNGNVDYLGNACNYASRLESFSKPGEISVSADVWDQIEHIIENDEFAFPVCSKQISHVSLKGVDDNAVVYSLLPSMLKDRWVYNEAMTPYSEEKKSLLETKNLLERDIISLDKNIESALMEKQSKAQKKMKTKFLDKIQMLLEEKELDEKSFLSAFRQFQSKSAGKKSLSPVKSKRNKHKQKRSSSEFASSTLSQENKKRDSQKISKLKMALFESNQTHQRLQNENSMLRRSLKQLQMSQKQSNRHSWSPSSPSSPTFFHETLKKEPRDSPLNQDSDSKFSPKSLPTHLDSDQIVGRARSRTISGRSPFPPKKIPPLLKRMPSGSDL